MPNESNWEISQILVWIAILASIALIIFFVMSRLGPTRLSVPYSALVDQVRADNVHEVTIEGLNVSGEFRTQMELVNGELVPVDDAVPPDEFLTDVPRGERFESTIPEGAQADFVELLQQHDVTIHAEEPGDSIIPTILLFAGIPIFILLVLFLLLRRSLGSDQGTQQMLGFTRSRARKYHAERPDVTFADVAGEDEAKAELTQVVDFLRSPGKYRQLGAELPRGILLVGPPGTGKTLLAKAVAGQARVPFFSISASEFVEMFVGVGASRVRDMFEKAKKESPALIFVDELDAVGRQRFAGVGGGNDEREQTLNQLLNEMDGFEPQHEVIVLAATNRPDVLDPALLRPGRFDRQVTLNLSDRRGREAILQIHSRDVPIHDDVDLSTIAATTAGFSGADLANLVNEAALIAASKDKRRVERVDIEEAMDKAILGAARALTISEREKAVLAYHESGHALVAFHTKDTDPLRKVSIVPRAQSLGATVQAPTEDRFNYTHSYLVGRLSIMMGGRAAERLVFNEATSGSQNDLKEATEMARRMVALWGMSDEIGPLFLGMGEQHVFLGREMAEDSKFSDDMLKRVEDAEQRLLHEAMDRATNVLTEHRDQMKHLATLLIEEETIEQERIAEVLGSERVVGD